MRQAWLILAVVGGCSGKPSGSIDVVTGAETDALTRAPAPTRLVVEAFGTDGKATRLGEVHLPAQTLDLAEQKQATIATIRVTARDDGDVILASGSSLLLTMGSIAGRTLPIFVQRVGELARMPSPLADAREEPMLTVLAGRYVLVTGGTDPTLSAQASLYDLMALAPLANPPSFPFVPASIAPVGTGTLLLDEHQAKVFDFSASTVADAALPSSGGSLAEIAGGPTVLAEDGTAYVVGPARRTGAPTNKVLKIATDGTPSYVSLAAARLGAGATWLSGRGLVVVGGSDTAAGVEVLAPGATAAVPLGFPPDPRTWVAAPYDGAVVVLAGSGPPRSVDLGCASQCSPRPFSTDPFSTDPGARVTELYMADATGVFAVARDSTGTTHALRLSPTGATELPVKVPRKNARSVRLPTGAIALIGGATTIESFRP